MPSFELFAFFAMLSCETIEMHTVSAPPPSPIEGAELSNRIFVSCEIEQIFEKIPFDADKPWKSCYVPTDQIELKNSYWDKIKSVQGIYVIGKCYDGKFYEVAVYELYIPTLLFYGLVFEGNLDLDRTKPPDAEVRVYGASTARRRAETRFLQNVINAIWSGNGRGLELYCRRITPSRLQVPLEWAILNHDVLESNAQIQQEYFQNYVFIILSLLEDYDAPLVLELLRKNLDELLHVFRKDCTDLFASANAQQSTEFHKISLLRCLLVFSGGRDDFWQRKFDPEYTANDNANLYGSLFGITGSVSFGSFDPQAILNALSKSKVFTNDDICTLNIAKLTSRMMASLPIGFPQGYLDLPSLILCGLGRGQVDEIRVQIAHTYQQQPSLQIPENNVLILLTWSSVVQGQPYQILTEWTASGDGRRLYQRLIRNIQNHQTNEQLALTLAALLCYKRLFHAPNDTPQSVQGCYLADFDALVNGGSLSNERTVYESMILSFLRVVDTSRGDYILQILATTLDTDTPTLEPSDRFLDKYWLYRLKDGLTHKATIEILKRTESKSSLHWYNWWIFVSAVVLSASILRDFESSLPLRILLYLTCGESLTLCIRRRQRLYQCAALTQASLSFMRFILTGVFLGVAWTKLIDSDPALLVLLVVSTICTLQILLRQIHRLRAQSPRGGIPYATLSGVHDVEKGYLAE